MSSAFSPTIKTIILALFTAAILGGVYLFKSRPEVPAAQHSEIARSVTAVTIKPGQHSPTLPVYARVSTPNISHLSSAINADVKNILTLPGLLVKKGDVLMTLDDREAQLALRQREADLLDAKAQIDTELLQHENELFVIRNDKGARADQNRAKIIKGHHIRLQRLKAKRLRAESALDLAKLDLARTTIYAPFNGQITDLHASIGDRVRNGDPLITLYDRQSLELIGSIPRRHYSILRDALNNQTSLQAESRDIEMPIQAQLVRLSGQIGDKDASLDAMFSIQSKQDFLTLGQRVVLAVQLPAVDRSFTLPLSALYGTDTIYQINNNRLKSVKIRRLGDYSIDGELHALIQSDHLKSGDTIMTTQLPNAVENLLVKVTDEG